MKHLFPKFLIIYENYYTKNLYFHEGILFFIFQEFKNSRIFQLGYIRK